MKVIRISFILLLLMLIIICQSKNENQSNNEEKTNNDSNSETYENSDYNSNGDDDDEDYQNDNDDYDNCKNINNTLNQTITLSNFNIYEKHLEFEINLENLDTEEKLSNLNFTIEFENKKTYPNSSLIILEYTNNIELILISNYSFFITTINENTSVFIRVKKYFIGSEICPEIFLNLKINYYYGKCTNQLENSIFLPKNQEIINNSLECNNYYNVFVNFQENNNNSCSRILNITIYKNSNINCDLNKCSFNGTIEFNGNIILSEYPNITTKTSSNSNSSSEIFLNIIFGNQIFLEYILLNEIKIHWNISENQNIQWIEFLIEFDPYSFYLGCGNLNIEDLLIPYSTNISIVDENFYECEIECEYNYSIENINDCILDMPISRCPVDPYGCFISKCSNTTDKCIYELDVLNDFCFLDGNHSNYSCNNLGRCSNNGVCSLNNNNNTNISVRNCNDYNMCTLDQCIDGECKHTLITHNNSNCDDQNLCTFDECIDNHCYNKYINCSYLNTECTVGICNNFTGQCMIEPINIGNSCFENLNDSICFIEGKCSEFGVCLGTIESNICDDGIWCNGKEICLNYGECVSIDPIDCSDLNPCTIDSCSNDIQECVHISLENGFCLIDELFGPCKFGKYKCYNSSNFEMSLVCEQYIFPFEKGEICNDWIDNDCDSFVDNNCYNIPCIKDEDCPKKDTCSTFKCNQEIQMCELLYQIPDNEYCQLNSVDNNSCKNFEGRCYLGQCSLNLTQLPNPCYNQQINNNQQCFEYLCNSINDTNFECLNTFIINKTCSSGNSCGYSGKCSEETFTCMELQKDCYDNNQCTEDICVKQSYDSVYCDNSQINIHKNCSTSQCKINQICMYNGECSDGISIIEYLGLNSDNYPCKTYECKESLNSFPIIELINLPNNISCSSSLCNINGYCYEGECINEQSKQCNYSYLHQIQNSSCIELICNPSTGECEEEFKNSDYECTTNFINKCYLSGNCDSSNGLCIGTKLKDCSNSSLNNECQFSTCDPLTGECMVFNKNNVYCSDNDPCTINDLCDGETGECHGIPMNCSDEIYCNGEEFCFMGRCFTDHHTIPNCEYNHQNNSCLNGYCSENLKKCHYKRPYWEGNICGLTDIGECQLGTYVCINGSKICEGVVYPLENEICDTNFLSDYNCNGIIGDGCNITEKECNSDEDCLKIPCMISFCTSSHTCKTYPDLSKNLQFDNCTTNITDICLNGICISNDINCTKENNENLNSCIEYIWDTNTYQCSISFKENEICDDGNLCTINDRCRLNNSFVENQSNIYQCIGYSKNCNDSNPCTIDGCLIENGNCYHEFQHQSCILENFCYVNKNGICNETTMSCQPDPYFNSPIDCSDNNPCTIDSCILLDNLHYPICIHEPNTYSNISCSVSGFDNNNLCLLDGHCLPGTTECHPKFKNCSIENLNIDPKLNSQCIESICLPETGSCLIYSNLYKNDCDDQDWCTVNDQCNLSGNCLGEVRSPPIELIQFFIQEGFSFECSEILCLNQSQTFEIQYTNKNNQSCDTNNLCSESICLNGKCELIENSEINCSDNIYCNGLERCIPSTGECIYGQPIECYELDNNLCTIPICSNDQQCCLELSPYNDEILNNLVCGNSTIGECKLGKYICNPFNGIFECKGAIYPSKEIKDGLDNNCNRIIDDGFDEIYCKSIEDCPIIECLKVKCSLEFNSCIYEIDSLQNYQNCSDGLFCSSNSYCWNGSCVSVFEKNQNPCILEICSEENQLVIFQSNITGHCSDNNLCTLNDHCDGYGNCIGYPKNCFDNNPCTIDYCDSLTGDCIFEELNDEFLSNINCYDNNQCTTDYFNRTTCQCEHDYYSMINKNCTINDNLCIINSTCSKEGVCIDNGYRKPFPNHFENLLNKQCFEFFCDPKTGEYLIDILKNFTCIDEDDKCMIRGKCSELGECIQEQQKDCSDLNPCTEDLCFSKTGECIHIQLNENQLCLPYLPELPSNSSFININNNNIQFHCSYGLCIPINDPCDDKLYCNGIEKYNPYTNSCILLEPQIDCNDFNPCTIDKCSEYLLGNCLFTQKPGIGEPCGNYTLGECSQGILQCSYPSGELKCIGEIKPQKKDICDGLDRNCDGFIEINCDNNDDDDNNHCEDDYDCQLKKYMNNDCSSSFCSYDKKCKTVPINNNQSCLLEKNFENFCILDSLCSNGKCIPSNYRNCSILSPYDNQCSYSYCSIIKNQCVYEFEKFNYYPCVSIHKNNYYSNRIFQGYCLEGECQIHECEDNNPCTTDYFDYLQKKCINIINVGLECNHSNPCIINSTCSINGECIGNSRNTISIDNQGCLDLHKPCKEFLCYPHYNNLTYECLEMNSNQNEKECLPNINEQQNNKCYEKFKCKKGECKGVGFKNCSNTNQCSISKCSPLDGECYSINLNNGISCKFDEYKDDCIESSSCLNGFCVIDKFRTCDVGNYSMQCIESNFCINNTCQYNFKKNGTFCFDGDLCTINDYCSNGFCVSGYKNYNCSDCNSLTGLCNCNSTYDDDDNDYYPNDEENNNDDDDNQNINCNDNNPCTIDSFSYKNKSCVHLSNPILFEKCGISNIGKCKFGTYQCDIQRGIYCSGAVYPESFDICHNKIDDNCNGDKDENCEICENILLDDNENFKKCIYKELKNELNIHEQLEHHDIDCNSNGGIYNTKTKICECMFGYKGKNCNQCLIHDYDYNYYLCNKNENIMIKKSSNFEDDFNEKKSNYSSIYSLVKTNSKIYEYLLELDQCFNDLIIPGKCGLGCDCSFDNLKLYHNNYQSKNSYFFEKYCTIPYLDINNLGNQYSEDSFIFILSITIIILFLIFIGISSKYCLKYTFQETNYKDKKFLTKYH